MRLAIDSVRDGEAEGVVSAGNTGALMAMANFLALPLFPALRFREPPHGGTGKTVDFRALGRFFTRSGSRPWLLILIFFRAGEAMAVTMVNPMLVDLGYSLAQIGLLLGVAGSLAAFAGASAGGLLMQSLGRKTSLVVLAPWPSSGVLDLARTTAPRPSRVSTTMSERSGTLSAKIGEP